MRIQSEMAKIEADIRAAGISVAEFCRRREIHRGTWTRWRKGFFVPRADVLHDIQAAVAKLRKRSS